MKLLVIGSGEREHAIALKLLASPLVEQVFCAKGNVGMKKEGIQLVNIEETDFASLIAFAKEEMISWTIVGPEVPLLAGIVDAFEQAGLLIFGPRKQAAMIEGSKIYAKQLMNKYNIPTADYQIFTEVEPALEYTKKQSLPIVIKKEGLAAWKGVIIAETYQQAEQNIKAMLAKNEKEKQAMKRIIIEEFLQGEEVSLLTFIRGTEVFPMPIVQDHKRAFDKDKGPNTGGMGAYSPVQQFSSKQIDEAVKTILIPTAKAMAEEKCPFVGILYAGLLIGKKDIKVIEFNARFGDPETQVLLPRLQSDLAQNIDDLLKNKQPIIQWQTTGYNLGVVVAAKDYPGEYKKEETISEIRLKENQQIYYAGVDETDGTLVTAGGRLFLIESSGDTLKEASENVYGCLNALRLDEDNMFYRKDIGEKGILATESVLLK
ncbi:phosphoribosylamine--glycine ligase [Melissococcus plutonius ATCC 35311]|uniref:Phosphoribosylamine--glycine ligase n=1 Tax=Melissococcus plutonius (strain ATCC 35311 / DSM 29964 / CIP 104052 / LMG 20360 / NCIMB 702443) TaxID=940190 RepID=F3YBA0_MELPT|nr:phosphoribosylamine--glycine ligase [Melissococcus plutonius]MBB5177626.1 phosphoribosylamine--glycine ligase [Melissococcus plutonius]BAK21778.1 phosphoribosylamine--glycine ligase [Melissococcus plutonius ATCC 35311]